MLVLLLILPLIAFCWWARGRGYLSAIKQHIVAPTAAEKAASIAPKITVSRPPDGATDVALDAVITAEVSTRDGLSAASVTPDTVMLIRTADQKVIPAAPRIVQTNQIELRPRRALDPGTNYTLYTTSAVKDAAGRRVPAYAISFSTTAPPDPRIRFEQSPQESSRGVAAGFTCLQIGPDHKLYASSDDGRIFRFPIAPQDGMLGTPTCIDSLRRAAGGARLITGFCFDPGATADHPIIWVAHGYYAFADAPDWSGRITRLSGPDLEDVRDVVVNLPRSARDHLTNQPSFGPDGALYIPQGSNTAFGGADPDWSNRPERLLSASILRLDVKHISFAGPIDAKTADGGGSYDPAAPDAPLTIYASGVRLAYDLVWADDGRLYVPVNGSAAGGNAPGPRPLTRIGLSEDDWLFRIAPGKYHGHPNPQQNHFILNGGNPTAAYDFAETPQYPLGTAPDADWVPAVHSFGKHASADGIIQYKSPRFGGALRGKLLVCRYNVPGDIAVLQINRDGTVTEGKTSITGFEKFTNPLDLTEDRDTGRIYVSEYGARRITLLRPVERELADVR